MKNPGGRRLLPRNRLSSYWRSMGTAPAGFNTDRETSCDQVTVPKGRLGSGVSTFSKRRRRHSCFQTNAEFNTRLACCHPINPSGKWAYGPPKSMKMIGGPFKPFFGLSGVHFEVAGSHFRRSERSDLRFAEGSELSNLRLSDRDERCKDWMRRRIRSICQTGCGLFPAGRRLPCKAPRISS